MLYFSLAANIALAIALLVLFARARQRIIDEKVATFGGCLAAIVFGIMRDDPVRMVDAMVEGLRRMRGGLNGEDIKYHLIRAAACRLQRNDVGFDLLGEHVHVLSRYIYPSKNENEKVADYVHDRDYANGQPSELFGDEGLFLAEIQEERPLLAMYRASIGNPNPFGNVVPALPLR